MLNVTALGDSIAKAKLNAYRAVKCIRWPGAWCRKDISDKALQNAECRANRRRHSAGRFRSVRHCFRRSFRADLAACGPAKGLSATHPGGRAQRCEIGPWPRICLQIRRFGWYNHGQIGADPRNAKLHEFWDLAT